MGGLAAFGAEIVDLTIGWGGFHSNLVIRSPSLEHNACNLLWRLCEKVGLVLVTYILL